MESRIFKSHPLIKQSFAQRILHQQVEENAIIAVNNLLAEKEIRAINQEDLADIDNRYGTELSIDFTLNLEEFYATYLNHCLKDSRLDHQELQDLQHLKHLFQLSDKTIESLHKSIGSKVYKKTFQQAVSDGMLTTKESEFLNDLECALRLPKEIVEKISEQARKGVINEKLSEISEDFRLSPDEEKELLAISANLGVSLPDDRATKKQLEQMKHYWALENLDLPIIDSEISLHKDEICHFKIDSSSWKKVYGRNWSPSNPFSRIANGKELSVKNSYKGKYLETVDQGVIYLTNRRIIFDGIEKRTSIKLVTIQRLKLYSDALEIVRETGKNPILLCNEPGEFAILLSRLLQIQ